MGMPEPEILTCLRPGCGHMFREPTNARERMAHPNKYCSPSCETAHKATGKDGETMQAMEERFLAGVTQHARSTFDDIFRDKKKDKK